MWGRKRTPTVTALAYADGDLDVVGESSFVANITAIRRAAGIDPEDTLDVVAWLVAEPTNSHDASAVAVAVPISSQAHVVGYLSRAVAAKVFPMVVAANKRNEIPSIRVEISESFSGDRGKLLYSVGISRT